MKKTARMAFIFALFLLPGLVMSAGEAKDEASKKELAKLQGTWLLESQFFAGKENPPLDSTFMTIEGNRFTMKSETDFKVIESGTFKIDVTQTPAIFDFEITSGSDKGKLMPGIYQLDGDTLKQCVDAAGKKRPSKFASVAGSTHALAVAKRVSRGPNEPDAKAMQGTWRLTHFEDQGKKAEILEKVKSLTYTFDGSKATMKIDGKVIREGSFELLPKSTPKGIDLLVKDEISPGIYKLEKDRLTICVTTTTVLGFRNKKRAGEFATKEGSRTTLMVLEREKQ